MLCQSQLAERRDIDFRRLEAALGEQAAYLTRLEVQHADLVQSHELTQSAFAALGRTQTSDMSSTRHALNVLERSAQGTQSALEATEVKTTRHLDSIEHALRSSKATTIANATVKTKEIRNLGVTWHGQLGVRIRVTWNISDDL